MNSFSKFSSLKPKLYSLEEERKMLVGTLQQQIMIGIIVFAAGSIMINYALDILSLSYHNGLMGYLLCGGIVHAIFSYFRKQKIRTFNNSVKEQLLNTLLADNTSALSYSHTNHISQGEVEESKLFDKSIASCRGEDMLMSQHCGQAFKLCELELAHGYGENRRIFFHGVFATIDLPQAVKGQTFIMPADYKESFSSRLSKKLWNGGRKGEIVGIEDPAFSEVFKVISNQPEDTQALLDDALRKALIDVEEAFAADLRVGLKGKKLYLAIETWDDLFAISHKENLLNSTLIEDFADELNALLEMINILSKKGQMNHTADLENYDSV